ncbi:MAG: M15 family metallopeptidase [Actinobacteria bacterium]|nr:M15 family metallopeptidase [Actinomycetota bacterium]
MNARRMLPIVAMGALACTPLASAAFRVTVAPISKAQRAAMTPSVWRAGCPVGLNQLRAVTATHHDFAGNDRTGTLIVNEAYGGDDWKSIEDDNTSAFNCRKATGGGNWSNHAYGRAIDINPIENPYVTSGGSVAHTASVKYITRTAGPGIATPGSPIVKIFTDLGWGWGGTWSGTKDYQHFSARGR